MTAGILFSATEDPPVTALSSSIAVCWSLFSWESYSWLPLFLFLKSIVEAALNKVLSFLKPVPAPFQEPSFLEALYMNLRRSLQLF